jgi:hypothetical protein
MEAEKKILGMLRVYMGVSIRSAAGCSINASIQKTAVDIERNQNIQKRIPSFIQDRFAFLN